MALRSSANHSRSSRAIEFSLWILRVAALVQAPLYEGENDGVAPRHQLCFGGDEGELFFGRYVTADPGTVANSSRVLMAEGKRRKDIIECVFEHPGDGEVVVRRQNNERVTVVNFLVPCTNEWL